MKQPISYTKEEKLFARVAPRIPPETWLSRLRAAEAKHGSEAIICAACLIWWDYFGNQTWPHLNEYKNAWNVDMEPPPGEVKAVLVACGYPPRRAASRVLSDIDRKKKTKRRKYKRLLGGHKHRDYFSLGYEHESVPVCATEIPV